jgi:hypothetical protein
MGCYQSPQAGKHQGWVPMASPPSSTQDEVASEEGCTDPHKRKLRWIAHIFDKGWEIGRILDEEGAAGALRGTSTQLEANIKFNFNVTGTHPMSRSTWFHVLHPTQYGPDGSWMYVVPLTNPRRSSRRR